MIAINLLPHRELARKQMRVRFYFHIGLALGLGLAAAALVYSVLQMQIAARQERNQYLQMHMLQLKAEIQDVATLQQELDGLKSRQQAVQSLQTGRNLPVYLFSELVHQMPDGVYLTALRQQGLEITLTGVAQSQLQVSELLRNLDQRSLWLTQPRLIEVVAAVPEAASVGSAAGFHFSLGVSLSPTPLARQATPLTPPAAATVPALAPAAAPGGG